MPKKKLYKIIKNGVEYSGITSKEACNIIGCVRSTFGTAASGKNYTVFGWEVYALENGNYIKKSGDKPKPWRFKISNGEVNENNSIIDGKIYIHKNKINGKCYVGQTIKESPESRWGPNGNRYDSSPKFYNAIKKYGWDNFEHIVLPENYKTINDLNEAEIALIEKYDSVKNGYNSQFGGFTNPMVNRETRKKISESLKGREFSEEHKKNIKKAKENITEKTKEKMKKNHADFSGKNHPRYGYKLTEEEKENLRQKNLGKKISEETKKKLSESGKIRYKNMPESERKKISEKISGENNPFYGKTHSPEIKEILRKQKLGKKLSEEHKRKISEHSIKASTKYYNIINTKTKELFVNITSKKALEIIGCGQSYFYEVARGEKKRALGWEVELYLENEIPFKNYKEKKED